MKKATAIILAASFGVCAFARDFSKEFEYGAGTPGEQWYNWSTGGDGALWDLGGVVPTLEDSFYYKGQNIHIYTHANQLADGTVYAKNMTFVGNYGGKFNVDSGEVSIVVAENLSIKIEQNGSDFRFGDSDAMRGFKSITIGGNLEIDGPSQVLYNTFLDKYAYGRNDLSMAVGGTVSFKQKDGRWILRNGDGNTNPSEHYMNSWIQLGGLNGENLRLSTNDPGASSFNLVFKSDGKTAFAGGEWTGAFTSWYNGGKTASITMDGGANGGMQTIRLLDSVFGESDAAMATQTLDMLSGKLTLGTGTKTKFTEATISGGELYIDDELSGFSANILNLDGGKLIFDVWGDGGEFIEVAQINGSLSEIIVNLSSADFQIGMDADASFDLFRGTSSADWDALNDRIKFMLDGQEVSVGVHELSGMYGNGVLTISGTISAVPEPAALAAVLGAFALALAACRRRK